MEVIRDEIVITMVFDCADESGEGARIPEGVLLDFLEDFGEIWVQCMRTVGMCVAEVFNIFSEVTKEEDIVLPNFAGDFNLLD
jgi:hypothetical protein